jgi:hypothetical protein
MLMPAQVILFSLLLGNAVGVGRAVVEFRGLRVVSRNAIRCYSAWT